MTKKQKQIAIGVGALLPIAVIIPVVVMSCNINDKSSTTNKVFNNDVLELKNIKNLTAYSNADITAANATKLLKSDSSNLNNLSKYFDTKAIENANSTSGVKVTYSASVGKNSNTLVITIHLSIGSITNTESVSITGFPNQAKVDNLKTLTNLGIKLSQLKLEAYSSQSLTLPSTVYSNIKTITTPLTLSDFSEYFDISLVSKAIAAVNTKTNPISISYTMKPLSANNIATGTVEIAMTLSIGSGNTYETYRTDIIVTKFLSANQAAINAYVKAFELSTDIKGFNTILPSNITNATGVNISTISKYITGVAPLPKDINATFDIITNKNSDLDGSVSLKVTLTAQYAILTTKTITVNNFETSTMALDNLVASLTKTYPAINQSQNVPAIAYDALKKLDDTGQLTINSFNTYFNISSINSTLSTLKGTTIDSIDLIPFDSASLISGTLQFKMNLSFNGAFKSVTIILTNFKQTPLSDQSNAHLATLKDIANKIDQLSLVTTKPSDTAQIAYNEILGISNISLSNLSPYFPTDSILALIPSDVNTTISLNKINSINTSEGTMDLTLTISLGTGINEASLTINLSISGFMTANQALINAYIKAFDSSTTIKGINTVLPSTIDPTTNISMSDIVNYINGITTPASGLTAKFNITINPNSDTNGIVSLSVTLTANHAISTTSKAITVSGFDTTYQIAVKSYTKTIQSNIDTQGISTIISGIDTILPNSVPTTNIFFNDIANYFKGVPTPKNDVVVTFKVTNENNIDGTVSLTIILSAPNQTPVTLAPIQVSGFETTNEKEIKEYMKIFESSIDSKNVSTIISGINTVLPTNITTIDIPFNNIANYFKGVPTPGNGIKVTFKVTNEDDTDGTVSLTINLSAPNATSITSQTIKVNGFLTTNQAAINNYIKEFEQATITGINTYLPSDVPSTLDASQINTYFKGIPAPTGLNATFHVSNSSDTDGTLNLSVSLVATNAILTTSTEVKVSGFETNNQIAIAKYIKTFENNVDSNGFSTNIKGINTVLPSTIIPATNISMSNITNYMTGITIPDTGIIVTFNVTIIQGVDGSDATGTANLTITLSASNANTVTSKSIKVNGFETAQMAINAIATSLTKTYPTTNQSKISPTTAYSALNELKTKNKLTISSFESYFDINPINTIIGNLKDANISSIDLNALYTSNSTDGTLEFKLNLLFDGASSVATITLTGFQKTTLNAAENEYLKLLLEIQSALKNQVVPVTPNQTNVTAQYAYNQMIKIKDTKLQNYSNFFANTIVTTILDNWGFQVFKTTYKTGTVGSLYTNNSIYINPLTKTDIENGTMTLTISLSISTASTGADTVTLKDESFTVSGFAALNSLKSALPANSVYANYWSATPTSSDLAGLGNSSSSNSLYINTKKPTFDSSMILASSGTTLPPFITLPTGLTANEITSWTMVGNNTTGIATYTLNLKGLSVSTATLSVSGFMTEAIAKDLVGITAPTTSNINTIVAPKNQVITSLGDLVNLGIDNINGIDSSLGTASQNAIINSDPAKGTANLLITFDSGLSISIPLTGYKK